MDDGTYVLVHCTIINSAAGYMKKNISGGAMKEVSMFSKDMVYYTWILPLVSKAS